MTELEKERIHKLQEDIKIIKVTKVDFEKLRSTKHLKKEYIERKMKEIIH
jgi:hypothetical protein